jgi:hypothetical protein
MNAKLISVLLVGLCFGVAAGCSSRPSESEGRKTVQTKVEKEAAGRIRLISFVKTNGQAAEVQGVKIYRMSYELEIEFTEGCKWFHHPGFPLSMRTEPVKALQGWDRFGEDMRPDRAGEIVKAGDRRKLAGELVFEKTEEGWRTGAEIAAPSSIAATSPTLPAPPSLPPPLTPEQERQIKNNLRQLSAAADQVRLEKSFGGTGPVVITYADLVGPDKFVRKVESVVGENYSLIRFDSGALSVTTPRGELVRLGSN